LLEGNSSVEWCKTQYGKDLTELARLINKFDVSRVFKNIDSALNVASGKLAKTTGDVLSVNVAGVELILKKKISGTIPHDLNSITIFLEVNSEFDLSKDIATQDRILDSYCFQMEIIGINEDGSHFNAWHLDKDIRVQGANAPKYDHPLYHFQIGGNRLEDKPMSGAVFVGAPRLPHPPMDIILGIHFIMKNFCSTKDYPFVTKLFIDPSYQDIVDRAKKRLFSPYFKAFSDGNQHEDFTLKNVFPMAV
tara:strand:- start:6378 stop:7124 length:747 start_codon:yes stop_codon:yes gene_type:complete